MVSGDGEPPFGPEEWSACLKVLEVLGDRPDAAPDRERIERLVARLYRKTRGLRRKAGAETRRQEDRDLVERTGRVRAASGPEPLSDRADEASGAGRLKAKSRRCYICNSRYREVHQHYHLLCPPCALFNAEKRRQRADLSGRRAIVTGGRIKIGYQAALKLLRDGAEVLVTTRFPRDAASRYAEEPDFDTWAGRLQIEGLDFRFLPAVVAFADGLLSGRAGLDILINNAAQTVRRTPDYFADAEALERMGVEALPANLRPLLGVEHLPERSPGSEPLGLSGWVGTKGAGDSAGPIPALIGRREEPPDHREQNSWTTRLAEVGPVELLEVLLINATAPFVLIGRLKPLLLRSPFPDRYVVNVAGLDGQFGRAFKTDRHPHVNMSKAALNMITRTSAADYARDGIYMNSVDAGWITHEGAHSSRVRMRARGFVPPLDEIDGAARIYDPIVRGLDGHREFGQFYKDYTPTGW
jgi:NAD(P)-dependent dehydrogenase (short-subunit alcohol dehydrogenase family)